MPQKTFSDTEILNWIESELQRYLGAGDFWVAMHEVHKGLALREACAEQMPAVPPTLRALERYEDQPHIRGPWYVEDATGAVVAEGLTESEARARAGEGA